MAEDDTVATLLVAAGGSDQYIFEQLDEDGDGVVEFAEFDRMLSSDAEMFVDAIAASP